MQSKKENSNKDYGDNYRYTFANNPNQSKPHRAEPVEPKRKGQLSKRSTNKKDVFSIKSLLSSSDDGKQKSYHDYLDYEEQLDLNKSDDL